MDAAASLILVSRFAQQTMLISTSGNRDALVTKFLESAEIQRDNPSCEVMFVSTSPVDERVVYLTEVWTSEEAWEEAVGSPETSAWAEGMAALVAERPESIRLTPIGGKGLGEEHG